MGNIGKGFSLLLAVILAISSLMMVESASAQSLPKPSTPEFTIRYVDRSYAVGATYDIDIYTGKNVTTHEAYYVQSKTMELTIKNQAFTAFKDSDNHSINLYYSVRMKGHFGDSWTYPNYGDYYTEGKPEVNYVRANTSSDFTVIAYGLVGNNGTVDYYCFDISAGGQADFQVQAFIGYDNRTTFMGILGESHQDVFTGQSSDWSNTHTVSIPDNVPLNSNSPSPTPTPTMPNFGPTSSPTPTANVPEFLSWTIPLLLTVMVAVAGLLVYIKKRRGKLVAA